MLHLPVLRSGRVYESLTRNLLTDIRSGDPVAEVSLANPGLIARDLARATENQRVLAELSTADLIDKCGTAARLFVEDKRGMDPRSAATGSRGRLSAD